MNQKRFLSFRSLLFVLLVSLFLAGCNAFNRGGADTAPDIVVPGGDPQQGRELIEAWGCGSCHTIPGIPGANAMVGPPLNGWAQRHYIAGYLTNTPENLIGWLMDPPAYRPDTVMPNLGISEDTARHMSAYLYSLKKAPQP